MSIWSFPDILNILKGCISDKLSARDTAVELSKLTGETVTRNAVIGKAKRKGISLNPQVGGRPKGYQKPRQTPEWKPMPKLSTETAQPFEFLGLNIWELQPNSCRYIEGEVRGDHAYCGQPTEQGSWCAHHLKIVKGGSHVVYGGKAGSLQNGSGRAYRSHPGF